MATRGSRVRSARGCTPVLGMSTSRRCLLVALALVALALVAATAACGPSAAQLRAAREARYPGSRVEILRLAQAAVEPSYPIAAADPDTGTITTTSRIYEPDGSYLGTSEQDRKGGFLIATESGQVLLGFEIRVVGETSPFQVLVAPVAEQARSNYSAPYRYLPDDPAMPGWILGKVDRLQLEVHQRLTRWLPAGTTVARQ